MTISLRISRVTGWLTVTDEDLDVLNQQAYGDVVDTIERVGGEYETSQVAPGSTTISFFAPNIATANEVANAIRGLINKDKP